MKLLLTLIMCAVAAAAPSDETIHMEKNYEHIAVATPESMVRDLILYVRRIIANGSPAYGIPPLDPLKLDSYNLIIPAGLINLDLELKGVYATGLGGFIVNKSDFDLRALTLDLDITIPTINISTKYYNLLGNLFTTLPLYGKGSATFRLESFRFEAKLWLKQSVDKKSLIIDRIENVSYEIPVFKSAITGAIGGGDIDAVVNAIAETVFIDYVNRFQGAIGLVASRVVVAELNPILEKIDSWRFIGPFMPPAL